MDTRAQIRRRLYALTAAALIAAIYAVLCLLLAPLSFGPVQVRVSEALTLLPALFPQAIAGVTLGCFLANMLGGAPIDMAVGTLATFLAALCTWALRARRVKGLPVLASLPPVLFNAVIVGVELTLLYFPAGSGPGVYAMNMVTVGLGQVVSCCLLGIPLVALLERSKTLRPTLRLLAGDKQRPDT